MDEPALLIMRLRRARLRARATAAAEALHVLHDLGAELAPGGPLSERGGVFWISLPASSIEQATQRVPLLGYTCAVDLARPAHAREPFSGDVVVWRKRAYRLVRLYEESTEDARERAPDRRVFAIETKAGVRVVRGYRGDSRPSKRRGLPAYDARMLVNIAAGAGGGSFLDPFAGAGGLVIEAVSRGCRVISGDIDPSLRYGLTSLGASHVVADARRLPFAAGMFDAIATELPYEPDATDVAVGAMSESARVLREGGWLAMLGAASQADALRRAAERLQLTPLLDEPLDRKGVACAILAWAKR